jgi:hypothetical protein
MPGVIFDLRTPAGVLVDGWTGDDGTYGPAGLTPGNYWIDLHVPAGYIATTPTTRGPLAINGNAIIGQDFGLAQSEWCSDTEETTTMPVILPVTGSESVGASVLAVLIGLLTLAAGSWLDRRGGI